MEKVYIYRSNYDDQNTFVHRLNTDLKNGWKIKEIKTEGCKDHIISIFVLEK